MFKVFISQAMHGRSDEEILSERNEAIRLIRSKYHEADDIVIVDNFVHTNVPENAGRVWHLGTSIRMMDGVDAVYFCPGWEEARGCRVERLICLEYGIRILEDPEGII